MSNGSRNFGPADSETNIPDRAPDCRRCRHFKITWEPAFPRACLLFGVKCKTMPATEVFLSSGKHCFAFQAKKQMATDSPRSDLKDDK